MMQRATKFFVVIMAAWLAAATVVYSAKPEAADGAHIFEQPAPLDIKGLRDSAAARDQQPHTTRKLSNVQAEQQQPLSNPQQSSGKASAPIASPPSPPPPPPPPPPTAPASATSDSNSIIVEFAPLEGAAQADIAAAKIRASSSASPRLARVSAHTAAPQPPPVLTLLRTMFAGRKSQDEAETQLTLGDADDILYGNLRSSGLQGFNFTLLELGSDGALLSLAIARDHPHATIVSIDGNSTAIAKQAALLRAFPARNFLLGQRRVNESLIADLLSSSDLFEFLLLHHPYDLVASLLPMEFEEQLGRLLALARTSYVLIPNRDDLDRHHCNPFYFSYWPSHRSLITAAAATARLFIRLTVVSVWDGQSLFRVDLVDLPWRRLSNVEGVEPLFLVPEKESNDTEGSGDGADGGGRRQSGARSGSKQSSSSRGNFNPNFPAGDNPFGGSGTRGDASGDDADSAQAAPRQLSLISLQTLFALNVSLAHRAFLFRRFLSELDVSHIEKHSEECVTSVLPAEIFFAADRLYFSDDADKDAEGGWDPHEPYRTAPKKDNATGKDEGEPEEEEAKWGGEVRERPASPEPSRAATGAGTRSRASHTAGTATADGASEDGRRPYRGRKVSTSTTTATTGADTRDKTSADGGSGKASGRDKASPDGAPKEGSDQDLVWTPEGMLPRAKWERLKADKAEADLIRQKDKEADEERRRSEAKSGAKESKADVEEAQTKNTEKRADESVKAESDKKESDGKGETEAEEPAEAKDGKDNNVAPGRKLLQLAMASGRNGAGRSGRTAGTPASGASYKTSPQQQPQHSPTTKLVDTSARRSGAAAPAPASPYGRYGGGGTQTQAAYSPGGGGGGGGYRGRYAGHEEEAVAELDIAEARERLTNADLRPTLRMLPPLPSSLEVEAYVEKVSFAQYWPALHAELAARPPSHRLLVHAAGTGLLSAKAARLFPHSAVVSVATDAETAHAHQRLLKLLDIYNNFICLPNVTATTPLGSLLRSLPDTFDVQFLPHAFESLSALTEREFLSQLGAMLSLATTTLIPLPNPRRLSLARQLFSPPPEARSFEQIPATVLDPDQIILDLVKAAAEMGGLRNAQLTVLPGSVLRVHAPALSRAIPAHYVTRPLASAPLSRPGVSLHTLTTLGLLTGHRRRLLSPLLAVGFVAADMSPWHLIYHAGAILHFPLGGTLSPPAASQAASFDLAEEIAKAVPGNGDFSLLDLGAGRGDTSVALAWSFPLATVVSVEADADLVEEHLHRLNKTQLKNNVVCQTLPDADLLFRLGESPEFFRVALTHDPLTLLQRWGDAEFTRFLSYLLPVAQAHYFTFPSPRLLSLCATILFPSLVAGFDNVAGPLYAPASHPLLPFQAYEARLLRDLIDVPGLSEIAISSVLLPSAPRSLIRVDLVNLTRTVHHHFDYRLDGHTRAYTLRYENQSTWLVRQTDKSRIVYDRFGVSLITLLRMGLTPQRREQFYSEFLHLPVYEDMATWNIQFKAGKLMYTDRDTEDHHFEKLVPYAYQILLALMNYKRTLQDFDRCGANNKVEYNFPWIGDCTKNRKFTGPCTQPANPVPCADGTCKSTFVECARSLKRLEEERDISLAEVRRKMESGELSSLWQSEAQDKEPAFPSDDAPREKTRVMLDGKLISM